MFDIIQGNCLEVLPTLDVDWNKVVIFSDPPYNIGYKYHEFKDKMKETEYFNFLKQVFFRKNGDKMIPHVLLHYPEDLHKYSITIGQAPEKVIAWCFNNHLPRQHRDICYYGIKPKLRQVPGEYKNPNDKRIKGMIEQGKFPAMYDWIADIQQVKNVSPEKLDHPCQIPVELMLKIIGVLPKDSIIIDPFVGSGSTGVACQKLGYDFIGIELDEYYCDIAKKRLSL